MGAQVLLVDDDELLLDVLATVLDLEEFDVRRASDGQQALDAIDEQRPSLVVCDAVMPGIDGFEVCRRIKQDPRTASLPVVLLTARAGEADRQAGRDAGCDAYLTKPFSALELLEILRSLAPTRPRRGRGGN